MNRLARPQIMHPEHFFRNPLSGVKKLRTIDRESCIAELSRQSLNFLKIRMNFGKNPFICQII